MNQSEFENEMIERIKEKYLEFTKSKEVLKEIFSVFHTVCEENNIEYFLACGSLLGVVRDDDIMPPWDRDIDVIIKYVDKDHLTDVLTRCLPHPYKFEYDELSGKYPYHQMRIFKEGYNSEYVHIDVFYLLSIPNDSSKQKYIKKLMYSEGVTRRRKYGPILQNDKNVIMYKLLKLVRFIYKFYPSVLLQFKTRRIVSLCEDKASDYYIGWGPSTLIYPKYIFDERKKICKSGIECYIPEKPDDFLKVLYSDFNSYMPIDDRINEFMTGYELLKQEKSNKKG